MKKSLIIILSFCSIFISCNSTSGKQDAKSANNTVSTSTSSSGGSYGTIECVIDGTSKTYKVTQAFFEIPMGINRTDPSAPKDGIEILSYGSGDPKNSFEFEFKKSGTSKIKSDATGDLNCMINYRDGLGATYTADDATIVVTSYNTNHVTGTFAGKFSKYDGGSNAPQNLQITDGKFDVSR